MSSFDPPLDPNLKNTFLPTGRLTNEKGGIATFSDSEMLYMNRFVNDTFNQVPPDRNKAFKRYHEQQAEKERKQSKITAVKARHQLPIIASQVAAQQGTLQQIQNSTNPQQQQLAMYTKVSNAAVLPKTQLPAGPSSDVPVTKKFKIRERNIFVNSQRRDQIAYPSPADFLMYLGRQFSSITEIQLTSLIMPNVDQAINDTNNKFRWINKEDIDLGYPVYTTTIHHGSYTVSSIQTELDSDLNTATIKRRGNPPPPNHELSHYFIMDVNSDKDLFNFTSLKTTQLDNNPIQTFQGVGIIRVNQPAHGFHTGDTVYVIGIRGIVAGIQSTYLNGPFIITAPSSDFFTYEVAQLATDSVTGGGTLVKSGKGAPWQLLSGTYTDSITSKLGYLNENSSETIPTIDPITTVVHNVTGILAGYPTVITCLAHGLVAGDYVTLNNFTVLPTVYSDQIQGTFKVARVPTPDTFEINYETTWISPTLVGTATVSTRLLQMNFPNHGFNRIVNIQQAATGLVEVTTLFPANIDMTKGVLLKNTNSVPTMDGFYDATAQSVLLTSNPDVFQIATNVPIHTSGYSGILTTDHNFYLYNIPPFGGFSADDLNNQLFSVRKIIDANTFTFSTKTGFASITISGGGSAIRINSKIHGWNQTQTNSPNGLLNKPINLCGHNYAYLCMPNVPGDLMLTTDPVQSVVAMSKFTTNPGYVIFDQYLTEPLKFDPPLASLGEIHFEFRDPDNYLLNFNGFEWQAMVKFTELVPVNDSNQANSSGMTTSNIPSSGS